MAGPLPVLVQGLGPMGLKILHAAQADPDFDVVAAVDVAEPLAGRDLVDVAPGAPPGITIQPTLQQARNAAAATANLRDAIVLHATGSYLKAVAPQLEDALQLGLHVVSTCEELSYPFVRHPNRSRELEGLARAAGRTIVGTGVNPGFVMDQLVVTLRAASHAIRAVTVRRVQDPRPRRLPFQRKVGLGLSRHDYDALAASGKFGHVGLEESGWLVAAGLGWDIDGWTTTLEPVQPDPQGPVLGTLQRLQGATADGRTVLLHFEAHSGVEASFDEIEIDGTPPLKLRFVGGVFGDDATAAAVLRAARVIPSAARGLLTVLDLPLRARPHSE